MIDRQKYVVLSLELHLFFGRIMKEHSLFLEAGFTPQNVEFSKLADQYKKHFEAILHNAVRLSNGIISEKVALSGELITDYTLGSEQKTQALTGIAIDQEITRLEAHLRGHHNPQITPDLMQRVKNLNDNAKSLLEGLIDLKTQVLNYVLSCKMFTMNYPLLLEHMLREAHMYKNQLVALENGQNLEDDIKGIELFWDQIMLEHALFIRGLLDPTEVTLIQASNDFSKEFTKLLQQARLATDQTLASVTSETLQETLKYRDFKEAGTKGINECKIRSVILPLLADHVLRESNHFIRLLKQSA